MANDYRQVFEAKRGGASDDKALLADIQRAAQSYLDTGSYVAVTLMPEAR